MFALLPAALRAMAWKNYNSQPLNVLRYELGGETSEVASRLRRHARTIMVS